MNRNSICYVTTVPMTVQVFLKHHIEKLATQYSISVASNLSAATPVLVDGVTYYSIPIARRVSLLSDAQTFFALLRVFRANRFDVVHSITPKAGILAMFSGWLVGVPNRVHTFTGQVWVTRRGWKRFALKLADRVLAGLATHVLVDSPSQRDFLVAQNILPRGKATVIGNGAICGVDDHRFKPDAQARATVRKELGIDDAATVLLFTGRLTKDKGIADLVRAFKRLDAEIQNIQLLLVGPDEDQLVPGLTQSAGGASCRVRHVGYTESPERFMAASDILCLPSYREGFGMVVIEAGACMVPAVASRIYGITDAVVEGETGLLHTAGNTDEMVSALRLLISDRDLRIRMGVMARERAQRDFSPRSITEGWQGFYARILG